MQLICGQAVDPDLLKLVQTEVSELYDSVQEWQEESQDAQVSQNVLQMITSDYKDGYVVFILLLRDF